MNTKQSLTLVSTSALAAGMAQGSVVSSGPLNLQQTFSASQFRQGVSMGVSGTNDFVFGFEADATKPYVDARTFVGSDPGGGPGGTSGLMSLLAKANHGLPVTPGGTMIDASYASLFPALPAGRAYMNKDGDTGNVTGDWSSTATTDGYVGIELALGGGTSYGWLHFIDNPSAPSVTLLGWAYESTPNIGIETPVVPEPSVCALGALGLAGLLASRRRR
jgi:hypothetical protein